jgi:hypothetical protein
MWFVIYNDGERSYGWYGSEVPTIMAVHIIIVAHHRSVLFVIPPHACHPEAPVIT